MIRTGVAYTANSPYYTAPRQSAPQAALAQAAPSGSGAPAQAPAAATSQPSGQGVVSAMGDKFHALFNGDWVEKGAKWGHLWNQVGNAAYQGGQALSSSASGLVDGLKGFNLNGVFDSVKGLATGSLDFAKKSAMWEGGISVAVNGYRLFKGQEDFKTFGTNVTGDTLAGAAGGAGGAIGGAIGMAALGAFGVSGALLGIGGALVGLVGYNMAERAFRRTRIFNAVVGTVHDAL